MKSYSLWTALYSRTDGGCFWVKFGHSRGLKFSEDTAYRLAKNHLWKNRDTLYSLNYVLPGGPVANGWKDGR